jgi:hypothetical protein
VKSPPRRFALLAACLLVAACASAPETKTTPRKKKHKKHDDDDVAEKHTKKKKSSDDDSEKPDKPKKKTADASEDDETVTVDDDEEESSSAKAKKNKKKKEAEEKAEEEKERKQREKEEKAEREKQKAEEEKERKQREKEEKAEREKAKAEEEKQAKAEREKEAKAKKKKKADEEVAEDDGDGEKPAKKKKKNVEEVEEEPAEVDMTGDGDGEETKTAAKAKKGKAAPKTAAKGKAAKGKTAKAKKKADEEEPAETSDEAETAAAEEPEPETPVAEEKAKPSKGAKAKLAKAEKPAKTKGDKKTEPADADVIEMSGEENTESDTRVAAIPVPGVDSEHEEPELGAAKASSDEPAAAAVSMSAINDRPLTLAASKLEVHGGLRVNSITIPASMGTQARTQRSEGLALGVGYGVTDTLEVGADYTVLVNPGTVKGPITFHGAYRAYVTPKLEIAAAVGFALDFDPRVDPVTMKESTQTYAALELGAWARYRLGRKASLFSGIPATPSSSAPITNLAFPLPPEQYQLAIGLNGGPSALDFPIGIGYQLSSSFYTLFMTDLAHVGIKSSPNAFLFKDIIPFGLGGFYVFDKVDFGLVLSDDLKKDTLRFDAVVRYPIK